MSKYQEKNRVKFVEPTEINKAGTNGYQSPLEDLCISVDLEIIYSTRKACGIGNENGETKTVEFSSDNGTIVFNGGTNGFLTTNFTDITADKPWENTRECLGIKSIDISYNPTMYPQVAVKFTDIRGASLINSQELKSNYGQGEGSFYSLLYSTPSPKYKLTVKGFYGNPVVYNLVVSNTKLEFDASTGNFDITVNFIGYMFGVYSDVPMTYLAVAPYILETGVQYWEVERGENGRFHYNNGSGEVPMWTFPELRYQIAMAIQSEEHMNVADDRKAVANKYDNKIAFLQKLYDEYPFPCTELGERWEEPDGAKIVYSIRDRNDVAAIVAKKATEFEADLNKYNEGFGEDPITGFGYIYGYKDEKNIRRYTFRKDKKTNKFEVYKPDSYYESIKDSIDRKLFEKKNSGVPEYYLYVVDRGNLQPFNGGKILLDKMEKARADKRAEDRKYEQAENQSIVNALGFPPTIRNLFQMAFAHFETFVHVFYECTKTINSQLSSNDEKRKVGHYNSTVDMTDCFTDELPPFPAFYSERTDGESMKREEIWAGSLPNGSDLEEVKLVEAMISASKFYSEAETIVQNKINELKEDSITDEDINATLDDIYKESEEGDQFESDDLRLSVYMNLKQLYERWFCLSNKDRWKVVLDETDTTSEDGYTESDFANFIYIDSFYHNIGNRLMANVEAMSELMGRCMPTGDTDENGNFSLFTYLSEVAQKNGGNLMALPVPFGGKDEISMVNMFTAVPYIRKGLRVNDTSTYVFLYPYQMSQHLNGITQYEGDSFMLTDNGGKLSEDEMPSSLSDNEGNYIGAFGVTYAKQNQAFFRNFGLNMNNPGVTESSIASTMNIASSAAQNPRATALFAQDVYRNYSNYSYECSMEMMGNAQIMPMMYFQLNGIPMWNGTYMIKSVSHSITPGNMTTSFSGYRMNKNAIPLAGSNLVSLAATAWETKNDDGSTKASETKKESSYMEVTTSNMGSDRMEECVEALFDTWQYAGNDKFNTKSHGQCSGGVYRIAQMYYLGKKVQDVIGTRANSAYKVGKVVNEAPYVPDDLKKQFEGIGYRLQSGAIIRKDEWTRDVAANNRLLIGKLGKNLKVGDIIGYFPVKNRELYTGDGHWHAALYKGKPSEQFRKEHIPTDKRAIANREWVSDFRQNNAMVYSYDTLTKPDAWVCYLFKC